MATFYISERESVCAKRDSASSLSNQKQGSPRMFHRRTLLRKVQDSVLQHSTAKMRLDTCTQALSPHKQAAQSTVVGMIRSKPSCTVVVPRVSG